MAIDMIALTALIMTLSGAKTFIIPYADLALDPVEGSTQLPGVGIVCRRHLNILNFRSTESRNYQSQPSFGLLICVFINDVTSTVLQILFFTGPPVKTLWNRSIRISLKATNSRVLMITDLGSLSHKWFLSIKILH